jgi:hypothetical protein
MADLADSAIDAPLQLDEFARTVSSSRVWTGSTADGHRASNTCADWAGGDSSSFGVMGYSVYADFHWSQDYVDSIGIGCSIEGRLYCFADNDHIHLDSFERTR